MGRRRQDRRGGGVDVERVGDDLRLAGVVDGDLTPRRHHVELLGGVGRVVAFEHVDDDDRDVVATAGGVGRVDEGQRGGGGVVGVLEQDALDDVVGHLVDEAVAAQHEPVGADDRHRPRVDADERLDAEGAGDDVAARVGAGLLARDRTLGDELLHEAVVDRHLAEAVVAQHVAARVADVRDREHLAVVRVVDDGDGGDGGAHAGLVEVLDRRVVDLDVRLVDRRHEVVAGAQRVGGQAGIEPVDRHLARDLTGEVATHAVGDDEQARADVEVVLVLGADLALVGSGSPAQRRHHWASSTV